MHRAGRAAALICPARRDPHAAGLHPAAHRLDPGADPPLVPAGEAARRRPDQGVGGGQHDDIPGISQAGAQAILAEIGLDMSRFPTAGHLVSWAKLSPRTIQSGASNRSGKTGKGNPYLKGTLGEAAATAARTNTFLGER